MKKDPSTIVPFRFPQVPIEEINSELFGPLAMLFSAISLILRIKVVSLVGLFFSVYSLINQKESERQGAGSGLSLSVVAFLINYVTPFLFPQTST